MFKYTEKKFAKELGRVAESIDPSLKYEYLPDTREVKLTPTEDGVDGPYTVFLGNIFLKVSGLPRNQRRPAIEAFLQEILKPKELSPDEIMESLALRVRTEFEIGFRNLHIELMGHEPPPSIAVRRGNLLVEIVCDREESISLARKDDLEEIGVSAEEAFRMAAAKIRRGTDEDQWESVDESIWISRYQDDYDFARLVAAEDFGKFPFAGAPIVFAPSHSICLATGSTDRSVLMKMVDLGNELAETHRPFSQLLWTFSGSEWKEWKPPLDAEASEVAQLQTLREKVTQYEESKSYHERLLGEEVFVATFQAVQDDDGLTCYCVYTFDLPSYLPRTDFVAIVDRELPEDQSVVGRVDWNEFESIIGDKLEPIEKVSPAWYRLMQPLDTDQKDRIRKIARPL